MEIKVDNELATFIHLYDYLNGGYYASHNQLRFFDEQAYNYYKNDDKTKLLELYNKLRKNVPEQIYRTIEKSAGIRYFCCDGCHDARIVQADFEDNCLTLSLDVNGMLGCLKISRENNCTIKIYTTSLANSKYLVNDVKVNKKVFWVMESICFDDDKVILKLGVELYKNNGYEKVEYELVVDDITIE